MRRAVLALGLLAIFLASSPIGLFGGQHEAEPTAAHAAAAPMNGAVQGVDRTAVRMPSA